MAAVYPLIGVIGIASLALALVYSLLALVAVLVWRTRRKPRARPQSPPVTLLKPLCGIEPGLYEHLRSFCEQAYPRYQIIFGVSDGKDLALSIATQLKREYPDLRIDIVVDPKQHGHNRKISSLINMMKVAEHDLLVMSDSDAFVRPDYLAQVTAPVGDPGVGLVTCLYHGEPTQPIWSRLGAMYINEWYMPSVLLAWLFGHQNYVSGQTLCLRKDTLQAIGGLQSIADHLADDYELGQLVRRQGLRIVLSSYGLRAEHHEMTLQGLVDHELRWMRTLYVLAPWSFRFLFFTFTLPLALLGLILGVDSFPNIAWPLFQLASHFTWRGSNFGVGADGIMRKLT